MGFRPNPICAKCETEMRPERNGMVTVTHSQNPPQPYEIYMGDLWKCPVCGVEIVTGFPMHPIATKASPAVMEALIKEGAEGDRLQNVYERYDGKVRRPPASPHPLELATRDNTDW